MYDVHWSEGMLLLPQHLQLFRSFAVARAEEATQRIGVGRYGIRAFEWRVSTDAVEIVAADVTLPSGTVVRVPSECSIPPAPLGNALMDARGEVDVFLGVPYAQEGVSIVASDDNRAGRYRIQSVDVRDEVEATQRSVRNIMVRRLNARLFLGDEDRSGYDCVAVGRLGRTTSLEPVISPTFVPPLLDVTASASLQRRLTDICDSLRKKADVLGEDIVSRPFTLAQQAGSDPSSIFKLHALNTELGALDQLCRTRGVHPFDTYLALCRLGGSLALFSEKRRATQFPPYDHERLSDCFATAIRRIEELFEGNIVSFFEEVGFTEEAGVQVCRMQSGWLEHGSEIYLGVTSEEHTPEELGSMIGSSVKLFARGRAVPNLAGIRLGHMTARPAALPNRTACHFFRLDREATDSRYWTPMQESLAVELAFVAEPPAGARFQLFVVPKR